MALKDWKPYPHEYHKRAFISKETGKIVSIGRGPKGTYWRVFTPYTDRKFKTLEGAKKRRLDYMKKNK